MISLNKMTHKCYLEGSVIHLYIRYTYIEKKNHGQFFFQAKFLFIVMCTDTADTTTLLFFHSWFFFKEILTYMLELDGDLLSMVSIKFS